MLEPTSVIDERAAPYATGTDFWNILTDEMHSLYQLSFLLTADLAKTEQCFISGMGECEEEIGVFMAWTRGEARRAILKHAIKQDEYLKQINEEDRIDDKTAFVIKHR